MRSDEIGALAAALAKAQGAMRAAPKMRENPHFRSKYADLAGIWDACREALASNGLSVVQVVDTVDGGGMVLETQLMHESGQWIAGRMEIRPQKPGPQPLGSELTYARRYALAAIVGVVSDDDDDANAAQPRERDDRPAARDDRAEVDALIAEIGRADSEPVLREWASDRKPAVDSLTSAGAAAVRAAWAKRRDAIKEKA